jgi:hypothetical protein
MAICTSSINILNSTFSGESCGDIGVDLSSNINTPLSEVNTVEEFQSIVYSELIDAKNRQSITAYPTLRLVYERYLDNNLCSTNGNGYGYYDMQKISSLVGNYWVDLIEQFVPATAIWGSTLVYRNTVFDTQKYAYKSNTLWLCEDPSPSFPFSAISKDCNTQVIKVQLTSDEPPSSGSTPFDSTNFFSCEQYNYCDCVWTMTNNCSPEFIGRIIGGDEFEKYCETNLMIGEVPLYMSVTNATGCEALNQTWNASTRVFTQILKITDTSFIPITTEYNYDVIPYGSNTYGITMTLTKLDTNTLKIEWNIPVSAPDPIATDCTGYYINSYYSGPLIQMKQIWDVSPLVIVTEPEFNCEITRLFIYKKLISRGG